MENSLRIEGKNNTEDQQSLKLCIEFLNSIGIKTAFGTLSDGSFLQGISIENGVIIIDKDDLKFPGDILHEAGHIAIVPSIDRQTLNAAAIAKRPQKEAEEMMAIAWSYAASIHLGLDLDFVFHEGGYKGGGDYLAANFSNKNYIGVPMLQWIGLTADDKNALTLGIPAYPAMIKWLRD
jgi:hypothetical protein